MKVDGVLKCSFSFWYELFRKETIESTIIPLPTEALDYLAADGIILDYGGTTEEEAASHSTCDSSNSASLSPGFKAQVNQAIERMGGEIFPKLNWSSPKDAAWITHSRSLKCQNVDDVFLLLKSSDFIVHDLTEPFLECQDADQQSMPSVQYVLVLRKWIDIDKCNEFRCFVKDRELVAISQRHSNVYFPTLAENENHRQYLTEAFIAFFENMVKPKFPLTDYVFDAYVDGQKIILVDFNPWGIVTDSLLYTWNELNAIQVQESTKSDVAASVVRKMPEFRILTDPAIQPTDPFAGLYGVPLEYHRLAMDVASGEGKHPVDALLDLMKDHCLNDHDEMDK